MRVNVWRKKYNLNVEKLSHFTYVWLLTNLPVLFNMAICLKKKKRQKDVFTYQIDIADLYMHTVLADYGSSLGSCFPRTTKLIFSDWGPGPLQVLKQCYFL